MATSTPIRPAAHQPVNIVVLYHEKDQEHLETLESHLLPLCRENAAELWHRGKVRPGDEEETIFQLKLGKAHLILLLISAEFNATCDTSFVGKLEGWRDGRPRMVPVLLRPCDWTGLPFFGLRPIPSSQKPLVVDASPVESRFHTAAMEIRDVVEEISRTIVNPLVLQSDLSKTPQVDLSVLALLATIERERYLLERGRLVERESQSSACSPRITGIYRALSGRGEEARSKASFKPDDTQPKPVRSEPSGQAASVVDVPGSDAIRSIPDAHDEQAGSEPVRLLGPPPARAVIVLSAAQKCAAAVVATWFFITSGSALVLLQRIPDRPAPHSSSDVATSDTARCPPSPMSTTATIQTGSGEPPVASTPSATGAAVAPPLMSAQRPLPSGRVGAPGGRCTADSDCLRGQYCERRACVAAAPCNPDDMLEDCPPGRTCKGGTCGRR